MSAAQIIEELPRLSAADLNVIERRLQKLKAPSKPPQFLADKKAWARELDELAETSRRLSTGKKGSSIEKIINDIRDGR